MDDVLIDGFEEQHRTLLSLLAPLRRCLEGGLTSRECHRAKKALTEILPLAYAHLDQEKTELYKSAPQPKNPDFNRTIKDLEYYNGVLTALLASLEAQGGLVCDEEEKRQDFLTMVYGVVETLVQLIELENGVLFPKLRALRP